jgi:hypothetical protein
MAQPHTKRPNSLHQHCRQPQNDRSPGPPTRQTATKRPSPLPEAYEHAKRCTSTLDGPPAVPKAYEHGKWPQNDVPTPPGPQACQTGHVDPTSTPHGTPLPSGLRARRTGMTRPNPITKAHEHAKWAPRPQTAAKRHSCLPQAHEGAQQHTGTPDVPTRCRQGPRACQVCTDGPACSPQAHEGAKRRTTTPDGPSPSPSPTKTQNDARQPDSTPTVPKAHEHARSPPNDLPAHPSPTSVQNGGHVDARPCTPLSLRPTSTAGRFKTTCLLPPGPRVHQMGDVNPRRPKTGHLRPTLRQTPHPHHHPFPSTKRPIPAIVTTCLPCRRYFVS